MADFTKLFVEKDALLTKKTYTLDERDYRLVANCFQEYGFCQYMPGLVMRVLANELRKREVEDYLGRLEHFDLNSVPKVIDNIPGLWAANLPQLLKKKTNA